MYSQRMFNEYDQSTGAGFRRALCRSWMVQAYLPAAHALQEAHHIALLLLLKLLEVFVGTHLRGVLAISSQPKAEQDANAMPHLIENACTALVWTSMPVRHTLTVLAWTIRPCRCKDGLSFTF